MGVKLGLVASAFVALERYENLKLTLNLLRADVVETLVYWVGKISILPWFDVVAKG